MATNKITIHDLIMELIPYGILFLFVVFIAGILYYNRKKLSEQFAIRYTKEIFAFLLAFGTTNAILDFLKFDSLYDKLPSEFIGYLHHAFYVLILLLFLFVYRFLLTDIANRILEAIEKKYSETGAKFAEYYSVLFNLETHNDEFKILDALLRDYKKLSNKHQYLISLDAYLELTKSFFKDGYDAIGVNYLLPPFWIAPNFKNSSLVDYIDFFKAEKEKLNFKRITVLKGTDDPANKTVQLALSEIENSLDGISGAYLWILDLVQVLEIKESDFDSMTKLTPQEIENNLVIKGITWSIGVRHYSNSNSQDLIKNKTTEIEEKLKWFKDNLISVTNKKVNQKFKELHQGKAYYVLSDFFIQEIKSKYNWAEIVVFENKKFTRKIGIGVINNIDNAVLIEVIVDENQLAIINNVLSQTNFTNEYK